MIKNVIFDMGRVLIDFDPVKFVDNCKVNDDDKKLLLKEVYQSSLWALLDYGMISFEEAIKQMENNLPEHLRKYVNDLVYNWPKLSKPIEGMYELVEKLKENGYEVFLLSNAAVNQPIYWQEFAYSKLIDKTVISALEKAIKPAKEIYEIIMERYNLKADECLFIDDSNANAAGAIVAGMKAIVFINAKQLKDELKELGIKIS